MEKQQEHPPEEVSWVQPAESLVFSVSPVGSSGSNACDQARNDRKCFSIGSRDGGERLDEEDPPLMGEYIWTAGSAGDGGRLDDERNASEGVALPLPVTTTTPIGQAPRSHPLSDNNEGFSSAGEGRSNPSPHAPDMIADRSCEEGNDDSGDTGSHSPTSVHLESRGQQQQQQQQQHRCLDDEDINEVERSHEPPGGDSREGVTDRNEDLTEESNTLRANGESQQHHQRVAPEQGWDDDSRDENEMRWASDDDHNAIDDVGEEFAPAWDQGRPAEFDGGSGGLDHEDFGMSSRSDSSADEQGMVSPHLEDPRHLREAAFLPEYDRVEDDDTDTDVKTDSDSSSDGDGQGALQSPSLSTGRGREESQSFSRAVRRRTRLSLDRERRRLDRVPRSQRLSQVRGHPLGGMTLLQLEERHLLDVGIGQMTRQLARRRGRGGGGGGGGVRQSNEDLLRRSARLIRRAQEERDSRFMMGNAAAFHPGSRYAGGDTRFSNTFRDESWDRDARGRSQSAGGRKRGGSTRRRSRRPASASRDRGSRRLMSSSFSHEPTGGGTRDRAYSTSDYNRQAWGRTLEGEAPPMGLYSGGGTRCSLKQRRPLSAKPALTSGWEPGRARTRGRGGIGDGWDHFDEDDRRAVHSRGERRAVRAEAGDRSNEDGGLDYSDMSDVSPHGIVEYTDEEEGPFNVDELERVAASYLLRPRASVCLSSAAVDDDERFADDGSVYIYRENERPPLGNEQHGEEQEDEYHERDGGGGGGVGGSYIRGNFFDAPSVQSCERALRRGESEHWQEERHRTREVGGRSSSDGGGPEGYLYRGGFVQQSEAGRGERDSRRGGAGHTSAGANRKDHNRPGSPSRHSWSLRQQQQQQQQQQKQQQQQQHRHQPRGDAEPYSGPGHAIRNQAESGGVGDQHNEMRGGRTNDPSSAAHDGPGSKSDHTQCNVASLDGRDASPDRKSSRRCVPAEKFVVPVPGASYSPKIDRGLRGWRDRDKSNNSTRGPGEESDDGAWKPDAKVREIAARLRSMILDRQASANRSIREVFGHFDRRRCGYVNVAEMRDALADLRIKLSAREATDLHSMMALDGGDRLSYAEFVVFVTDPHHSELQGKVCEQAAEQLEGIGRRSFNLDAAFRSAAAPLNVAFTGVSSSEGGGDPWPETSMVASAPPNQHMQQGKGHHTTGGMSPLRQGGFGTSAKAAAVDRHSYSESGLGDVGAEGGKQGVSAEEFLAGLRGLGLRLSVSDAHRLIVRFDVHGDGHLSTRRFISMVESSRPWTRALTRLAHQEEADEEADACLRAFRVHGEWPSAVEQSQGQGAALTLDADIVEMARYIGIRVSSDSSLLWIAADALAAPLPNGWAMHKSREGRWFYHNDLTGQSRWDHPLDPHFRQLYLRERLGPGNSPEDKQVVVAHGPSAEASQQGTGAFAGEGNPHRQGGAGAVGAHGGPAVGRPNATPIVVSDRPPVVLPPRRMRPNVLDFTADKALDNLRARRLNVGGSSGSTLAGVAAVATAPAAVMRSTSGPDINANPAVVDINPSRHFHSSGELWTDGRGHGSNVPPASPAGPRRRRPVSASAVCEGLVDRGLGLNVAATDVPCPSGSRLDEGRGGGTTRTTVHDRPGILDPRQNQRPSGSRGSGLAPTAKARRPRSATAALQRPPPVAPDRHHHYHHHQRPDYSSNVPGRGGEHNNDEHNQREAYVANRNHDQSRPFSAVSTPISANEANGGREEGGGDEQHFSQEDGSVRVRRLLPQGNRGGVVKWSAGEGETAEMQRHALEEGERSWLRSRLVELCTKLDEAEALAKGEQQYQQQQHHSYAYHQSQQQRQQRQHVGGGDPTAHQPRVENAGWGSERGEGGGEGGRGNGRLNEPSRQPNIVEDTGSGNVTSENDRGRASGSRRDNDVLTYGENRDHVRHSSSGGNVDSNNNANGNSSGSNSSRLREEILELSHRMKSLETRMLGRCGSSSPTGKHAGGNDIDNGGDQEHYRGHHDLGPERRAPTASLQATGTIATTNASAQQRFLQHRAADHGGKHTTLRHGSQDDLDYRSPERSKRADDLSKKSWSPPGGSSTGAGVRPPARAGSSSSTSSSAEHSLALVATDLTSPHLHQWEGGNSAAGSRAATGERRSNGGGASRVERARTGARRSQSGRRSSRGNSANPPGIVLI